MGGGEQLSTKHLVAQAQHQSIATMCFLPSVWFIPNFKRSLFPCETISLPLLKVLPNVQTTAFKDHAANDTHTEATVSLLSKKQQARSVTYIVLLTYCSSSSFIKDQLTGILPVH